MKIRRITATPINLTLEAPYVWVFGELDGFSPTIVEVETEDGLIGLGEAPSAAAAAIIMDTLAPLLIGRDAFDIAGAENVCLPFWTGVQSINDRNRIMAFGAIEMALWQGRNQPLYQLLGGAMRKRYHSQTISRCAETDRRREARRPPRKLQTIAWNCTRHMGLPSLKASSRPGTQKSPCECSNSFARS